ncbi:dual specificity protein phosphatase family protein [Cohnella suwonensis]|uniref:Dual specificity protein phosphatase family protein n=1 Tax=Cohnella suwonensis TaxID=696072 RepID=A0ABW0LW39_9BACL
MEENYHSLHENRIFMGGAKDVEAMEKNEGIDVVVDLREESTGCAYPESKANWIKIPLGDNSTDNEHLLFKQAINEVVNAYNAGHKVAFHCGGGKGRTGTVAAGTLLALGLAKDVEEAEANAKAIRPVIEIKATQKDALKKLFPN